VDVAGGVAAIGSLLAVADADVVRLAVATILKIKLKKIPPQKMHIATNKNYAYLAVHQSLQ
jgi:hypothetical protein